MIREYEMTLIARSDLPETEIQKLLAKYEKFMTIDGGQILKKDVWGSRRLAFPINKQFRGFYANYDFVGVPAHLTEMERLMRIDESVLRYMSVKLGECADIEARRTDLNKPRVQQTDDDNGN